MISRLGFSPVAFKGNEAAPTQEAAPAAEQATQAKIEVPTAQAPESQSNALVDPPISQDQGQKLDVQA